MIRNRLNYYGEVVGMDWYESNRLEILRVIGVLKRIAVKLV